MSLKSLWRPNRLIQVTLFIVMIGNAVAWALNFVDDISHVGDILAWQEDRTHTCGGHFIDRAITKHQSIHFTANKAELIDAQNQVCWQGKTQLSTHNMELEFEHLCFRHDTNVDQWQQLMSDKPLWLKKKHLRVYANDLQWNKKDDILHFKNTWYRFYLNNIKRYAWGNASNIDHLPQGKLIIKHAKLTTCSIRHPTWYLSTNRIMIDRKSGWASSGHTVLHGFGLPIFYWPYLRFPIDKRRHSGWLYPTIQSRRQGWSVAVPWYWNIAPNRDVLFLSHVHSRRGFGLGAKFRYLTKTTQGHWSVDSLSNDRVFQDDILASDANISTEDRAQVLGLKTFRYGLRWQHHQQIDAAKIHADIRYMSDDYINSEMDNHFDLMGKEDIPSKLDIDMPMQGLNLSFRTYQVLKPIWRVDYERLFDRLPQLTYHVDHIISAQQRLSWIIKYGYFRPSDSQIIDEQIAARRLVIIPTWHKDFDMNGLKVKQQASLFMNDYNIDDQKQKSVKNMIPSIITTVKTPIKPFEFGHWQGQIQARWVPYHDQSRAPIFDTSISPASLDHFFNVNRFAGHDRWGDDASIGWYLHATQFVQKHPWQWTLAQRWVAHKHRVCLFEDCSADPLAQHHWSALLLRIKQDEQHRLEIGYDVKQKRWQNMQLMYRWPGKIIDMQASYSYLRHNNFQLKSNALTAVDENQIILGIKAHYDDHLGFDAHLRFDIEHNKDDIDLAVHYKTCCLSTIIFARRFWIGVDSQHKSLYRHVYGVRIGLTGLGHVG